MNPTKTDAEGKEFLSKFIWKESLVNEDEKARVEHLLVNYHLFPVRNRSDIVINIEFKVKLTPQHDKPVHLQRLQNLRTLRDDLLVELALMQEYEIITTLPSSKYSLPVFAQRKPNGKLRILVELRRINHSIKHDYGEHNNPVTTISDTAKHMAGKK